MPRYPTPPKLDREFWSTFRGWLVASLDGRYALTAKGRRELLPRLHANGLRLGDVPSVEDLQQAFAQLQRREAAAQAPEALRQALVDPNLSAENRAFLHKVMALQAQKLPASLRAISLSTVTDKEKAS